MSEVHFYKKQRSEKFIIWMNMVTYVWEPIVSNLFWMVALQSAVSLTPIFVMNIQFFVNLFFVDNFNEVIQSNSIL